MIGKYFVLAILLQALVDFLLMMGVSWLAEIRFHWVRGGIGVVLGGVYSVLCFLSGLSVLRSCLWHGIVVLMISAIVFGIDKSAWHPCLTYFGLRIAMDAVASCEGGVQCWFWATVLWSVWLFCIRGQTGVGRLVSIELNWQNQKTKIKGFVDTGNQLRDPISGKRVMVVGADVAERLTGLNATQLKHPVDSMGLIPGLRLIPYKSVGQTGGMLLALQLKNTKIGVWRGSTLVAFAPQVLDEQGKFQALIGGTI